ncbi:hypothetical protein AVEN_1632-1 [Araneus ventricosus]|uniref:Uncharacterized protein n=1 Tax=Araneus ventricosus TaxID=182803 RepID=A0A4Y2NH24_ARAVE|nr:hypothetical protein AVEN_1632-1 [Araneus ventricosus]
MLPPCLFDNPSVRKDKIVAHLFYSLKPNVKKRRREKKFTSPAPATPLRYNFPSRSPSGHKAAAGRRSQGECPDRPDKRPPVMLLLVDSSASLHPRLDTTSGAFSALSATVRHKTDSIRHIL